MESETKIRDALHLHEERLAAMLELHKQQVIEAVTHQLSGLVVDSRSVHNFDEESRCEQERQPSSQLMSLPLPAAMSEGSQPPGDLEARQQSSEEWVRHNETLAAVSHNLRMGVQDAMNRIATRTQPEQRAGCENSTCYKRAHKCTNAIYQSFWFEVIVSLTILVNATMMGVFAEWSLSAVGEPIPRWYRIGSACCLAVFVAEILIRWVTEGSSFMHPRNANFGWNMFDLALVLTTVADEVLQALHGPVLNVSFVRLARFLRLMRVTRVLRVLKHFKELRIMVFGMLNCGKPLLWASLLLGLISYMFMVFLLQISSEELRKFPATPSVAEQELIDFITTEFGSLRRGIYVLLSSITGGVNWQEVADPLFELHPVLFVGFLLYILLAMVCLMNLITAVFVEAAYQTSHSGEAQVLAHIEHKRVWIREAKEFFRQEFEQHFGAGTASSFFSEASRQDVGMKEFTQVVQAPRVRAWFEEHGLDIYFADARSLFELIDLDSDHKVDIHEFVAGLYRLKGGASSLIMQLEIQHVLSEIKSLKKQLEPMRTPGKSGSVGLHKSS